MAALKYWDSNAGAWKTLPQGMPYVAGRTARADWAGSLATTQNIWTSITGGAWTESPDDDNLISSAGVFTAPESGDYIIILSASFAVNATGVRGVGTNKNGANSPTGASVAGIWPTNSSNSGTALASGIMRLVAGDTIAPMVYVNGAAPNVTSVTIQAARIGGPQGPQGLTGPAGPITDYAMQGYGAGATANTVNGAWVKLPLGAVTKQSADISASLRYNADGTATILADGWYSFYGSMGPGTAGGTAGVGYRVGFWMTADDTTPAAAPPNVPYTVEFSNTTVGVPVWEANFVQFIAAGSRIGGAILARDAVVRAAAVSHWGIARVGSGPKGDTGPAFTTAENTGGQDFTVLGTDYTIPSGSFGSPGWYTAIIVGPNQIWEITAQAGIRCVTAVHAITHRIAIQSSVGGATPSGVTLPGLRYNVIQPPVITTNFGSMVVARLKTDATVPDGTTLRVTQEFNGAGANGRALRDGVAFGADAWRRV